MMKFKILFTLGIILSFLTGYSKGYNKAGGNLKDFIEKPVQLSQDFVYIPSKISIDDGFKNNYKYCIVYPGIGLSFNKEDENGHPIVSESPLTYPAHDNGILSGYQILTKKELLIGELNSPVKVNFKYLDKNKKFVEDSKIIKRILIKKCYQGNLDSSLF
jgi:hypothetical protein